MFLPEIFPRTRVPKSDRHFTAQFIPDNRSVPNNYFLSAALPSGTARLKASTAASRGSQSSSPTAPSSFFLSAFANHANPKVRGGKRDANKPVALSDVSQKLKPSARRVKKDGKKRKAEG